MNIFSIIFLPFFFYLGEFCEVDEPIPVLIPLCENLLRRFGWQRLLRFAPGPRGGGPQLRGTREDRHLLPPPRGGGGRRRLPRACLRLHVLGLLLCERVAGWGFGLRP